MEGEGEKGTESGKESGKDAEANLAVSPRGVKVDNVGQQGVTTEDDDTSFEEQTPPMSAETLSTEDELRESPRSARAPRDQEAPSSSRSAGMRIRRPREGTVWEKFVAKPGQGKRKHDGLALSRNQSRTEKMIQSGNASAGESRVPKSTTGGNSRQAAVSSRETAGRAKAVPRICLSTDQVSRAKKVQKWASQLVSRMQKILVKCFVKWLNFAFFPEPSQTLKSPGDLHKRFCVVIGRVFDEELPGSTKSMKLQEASVVALRRFLELRGMITNDMVEDYELVAILKGDDVEGWLMVVWELIVVRTVQKTVQPSCLPTSGKAARLSAPATKKSSLTQLRAEVLRIEGKAEGSKGKGRSVSSMTRSTPALGTELEVDAEEDPEDDPEEDPEEETATPSRVMDEQVVLERIYEWVRLQCGQLAVVVRSEKDLLKGVVMSALVASIDESFLHDPFLDAEDHVRQAMAHAEVDMLISPVLTPDDVLAMEEVLAELDKQGRRNGAAAEFLAAYAVKAMYMYLEVMYESTVINDLQRSLSTRGLDSMKDDRRSPEPEAHSGESDYLAATQSTANADKPTVPSAQGPTAVENFVNMLNPPNAYLEDLSQWKFSMRGKGIETPSMLQQNLFSLQARDGRGACACLSLEQLDVIIERRSTAERVIPQCRLFDGGCYLLVEYQPSLPGRYVISILYEQLIQTTLSVYVKPRDANELPQWSIHKEEKVSCEEASESSNKKGIIRVFLENNSYLTPIGLGKCHKTIVISAATTGKELHELILSKMLRSVIDVNVRQRVQELVSSFIVCVREENHKQLRQIEDDEIVWKFEQKQESGRNAKIVFRRPQESSGGGKGRMDRLLRPMSILQ